MRKLWGISVVIGLALAACGGGSGSDSPEPSAADVPDFLNESLSQEEMDKTLGKQFCERGELSAPRHGSGQLIGNCDAATSGRPVQFRIFNSETETRLWLENMPCQSGLFYQRGPTWIATAYTAEDAAMLEEAGATSLTCN
jgi:hypothetical protein